MELTMQSMKQCQVMSASDNWCKENKTRCCDRK